MKRIKWFESIDSYINASDKIEKNQVSFTFDTKQSWFTENYISARYVINSNYDSGGGEAESINTMDLIGTNVVGGREHYSRLIGSSNSNKHNINNKLQTYNEGGIDVSYSFNDDCECLNYVDDAFIIKERLNSLKFNVATDSYYYISVFAYNENISPEEYNNCNCTEFEFVIEDTINNGESYKGLFEIDENGQIYATQNGIDYMNQGISNGYKLVVLVYYDTIESYGNFQMIINDETILNVSCVEVNNYELQVLDYYETEIIDYISAIYINGQKQSEVMPYYYVTHTSNEFDVKIVFNTTNIPSMYAMFKYCDALTWVDFKHLTLNKGVLKDTSYMFSNCYSLVELKNLDKFDTSEVIDMRGMFQECYSIGCTNGKGLITNGNDGGGGGGVSSVDNLGVMPLSYNVQTYDSMESDNNEELSCEGSIINVVNNENCCKYDTDFSPSYDSYIPIKNINTNTKLIINDEFNINNDVAVCFCIKRNSGSSPGPVSLNASSDDDCESIENYFVLPLSSFTQISENELQINDNVLNEITYQLSNIYTNITHMTFMCAKFDCMATQPGSINNDNYCIFFPQECRISTSIYTECITCTFDLSKLNVSKVEYMSRMFQYCTNMSYINMSTWNTSNVTNMSYMFQGCESLIELNFSNWDMSNVYDSYDNFISNCYSLEFINLKCKMNPNGFTNNMSLYNIKEGGIIIVNEQYGNYYPSYLFETLIDEYGWNVIDLNGINYQLTIVENGLEVTEGTVLCNGAEMSFNEELNKWETSNNIIINNIDDITVTITYNDNEYKNNINENYLFIGDNSSYSGINVIETITVNNDNINFNIILTHEYYKQYIKLMFIDNIEVTPTYNYRFNTIGEHTVKMFIDTSNLTSMSSMFEGCVGLATLDLSLFDTSKVTDMTGMFVGCENLATLDLSSFDTSNVTNMNNIFGYCNNLTSLDVI